MIALFGVDALVNSRRANAALGIDISPVRGRDFPRLAKDDSSPRTSRAGKGVEPSQRLVPRTRSTHCGFACPSRYEHSQE
jgi:phosphopantetheinyl transferase